MRELCWYLVVDRDGVELGERVCDRVLGDRDRVFNESGELADNTRIRLRSLQKYPRQRSVVRSVIKTTTEEVSAKMFGRTHKSKTFTV